MKTTTLSPSNSENEHDYFVPFGYKNEDNHSGPPTLPFSERTVFRRAKMKTRTLFPLLCPSPDSQGSITTLPHTQPLVLAASSTASSLYLSVEQYPHRLCCFQSLSLPSLLPSELLPFSELSTPDLCPRLYCFQPLRPRLCPAFGLRATGSPTSVTPQQYSPVWSLLRALSPSRCCELSPASGSLRALSPSLPLLPQSSIRTVPPPYQSIMREGSIQPAPR